MNWKRLLNLLMVAVAPFAIIWGGRLLLALLWAPTSSPSRMVAFLAIMFAVTGAVLAVVVWAAKDKA